MSKVAITDWTFAHLVKQYSDFLLISLHCICYHRHLYDREYFTLARAYNCPVWKCKHPLLIDYLDSVVSAISEELRKCTVQRIAVVILSPQDVALERFVYDVSSLPVVPADEINLPFKDTDYQAGQLDGQFRAAMMKLATVESRLGPLPGECTFAVNIELKEAGKVNKSWVEAEIQEVSLRTAVGSQMVPLRRIVFGPIKLDSWVEETTAKLKLPDSQRSDERTNVSF